MCEVFVGGEEQEENSSQAAAGTVLLKHAKHRPTKNSSVFSFSILTIDIFGL
jgi:hypothetical protein